MLSKFEIDVSFNSLGNFATVGILWYDTECITPAPWLYTAKYIHPPNIIERIFGVTFADKVAKAKVALNKKANKHLDNSRKLREIEC